MGRVCKLRTPAHCSSKRCINLSSGYLKNRLLVLLISIFLRQFHKKHTFLILDCINYLMIQSRKLAT